MLSGPSAALADRGIAAAIAFAEPPALGHVIAIDGQRYELVSVGPHIRKSDGKPSFLLTWEVECPACGETFRPTSGLVSKGINRRCPDCVAPLKRVSRRRKLGIVVEHFEP